MNNNIEVLNNSASILRKVVDKITQPFKYWSFQGYQAEKYWSDRHNQNQFNLLGVGNIALSHEKNKEMYFQAKEVFLSLCCNQKIDLTQVRILDIGCGTGFYAKVLIENGAKQYLGVDITDVLFNKLKQDFSTFQFRKLDISSENINETFDLIIMIDVTQHITNNEKFSFAMQNIRSSLSNNGIFIVTSWLDENVRHKFYEVSRSLKTYQNEFPGFVFSKPIPFRDKFIFSIQKVR